MITGDKPNTAISIGRSTGIIDSHTRLEDIIFLNRGENDSSESLSKIMKAAEKKILANRIIKLFTIIYSFNSICIMCYW